MLFLFDENFSKKLAEGLDLLEKSDPAPRIHVDVKSAESFIGRRGASDIELIQTLGSDGVLFTKDKDFKQIKLLTRVIESHGAKVLFFKTSRKMIFFWDILSAIVNRWQEMKEVLSHPTPPFVFEFDIRMGIKECHL